SAQPTTLGVPTVGISAFCGFGSGGLGPKPAQGSDEPLGMVQAASDSAARPAAAKRAWRMISDLPVGLINQASPQVLHAPVGGGGGDVAAPLRTVRKGAHLCIRE